MKFTNSIAPLLLLPLAACGDDAPAVDTSQTGGKAAGEILGGTISDDMLPLEELTSTSPPAPRASGAAGTGQAGDSGDAESDGDESDGADTEGAEAPEEAPAPAAPAAE